MNSKNKKKEKNIFLFPGQGSQVLNMGKEIADAYPEAKSVFQEVDNALNKNLSSIIWGDDKEELNNTSNAQLAIMTTSIAILRAIEAETKLKLPNLCDAVAGHSLGEYSALCAIDSMSLFDTVMILEKRGKIMMTASGRFPGGMAAIIGSDAKASAEKLIKLVAKDSDVLVVANDNADNQVIISGSIDIIDLAQEECKKINEIKRFIKLPVSGAFHSPLMQDAEDELIEIIDQIEIKKPSVKLFSAVSGCAVEDTDEIRRLLGRQITSNVKWRELILNAKECDFDNFVEIGAGSTLIGLAKKTVSNIETFKTDTKELIVDLAEQIIAKTS